MAIYCQIYAAAMGKNNSGCNAEAPVSCCQDFSEMASGFGTTDQGDNQMPSDLLTVAQPLQTDGHSPTPHRIAAFVPMLLHQVTGVGETNPLLVGEPHLQYLIAQETK